MKAIRLRNGFLVLAIVLAEDSCLFKKEPRKATIVIPPSPTPTPPQPMPPPPQLPPATSSPLPSGKAAGQMPQLPAPTEDKPKQTKARTPRKTNTPAGTAPASTAPNAPAPGAATETPGQTPPAGSTTTAPALSPTPSLQPILATQEAADRNRRISQYLEKARAAITKAERNRPNDALRDLIAQVRTFVQQAEEARKSDLVRAENLAERAEVLARGLAK